MLNTYELGEEMWLPAPIAMAAGVSLQGNNGKAGKGQVHCCP